MRRATLLAALVVAASVTAGVPGAVLPSARAEVLAYHKDLNGDGWADLAIGVPDEDLPGANDAGAVNVVYGAPGGLSATFKPDRVLKQGTGGVPDSAEGGDRFGHALAMGDFNGDDIVDLAVGIPNEDIGGFTDAGMVIVLNGTGGELGSAGSLKLHQALAGSADGAAPGDLFGWSVAAGNFNGDGFADLAVGAPGETIWGADLAVGAPGETIWGADDAGGVHVFYGSLTGLTTTGDVLFHQGVVGGKEQPGDRFGWSLATGDFGKDFQTDLAVGTPHEDVVSKPDAGSVSIIFAAASGGLSATGARFLTQGGWGDAPEKDDRFGWSLAAGDFGGGSHDDIAVGVPYEDKEAASDPDPDAGLVHVVYGSSTGPSFWQLWNQELAGTGDQEDGDHFGYALVADDFGRNFTDDETYWDDLAIGIQHEDKEHWYGDEPDTGAVTVIYGTSAGLTSSGAKGFDQDTSGVPGDTEWSDAFGSSLAAGDYDDNGVADLAVGVPLESLDDGAWDWGISNAGMVNVLYGTSTGISGVGADAWHQSSDLIEEAAEAVDHLGTSVG